MWDDFMCEVPGTKGRTITWQDHTYTLAENIHYGYDPSELAAYEAGRRVLPPSVEPFARLVFPGLTEDEISEGLVCFEAYWYFDSPADAATWDATNLQEHLQGVVYADDRPGHDASALPDFGKE